MGAGIVPTDPFIPLPAYREITRGQQIGNTRRRPSRAVPLRGAAFYRPTNPRAFTGPLFFARKERHGIQDSRERGSGRGGLGELPGRGSGR
jgi:hypothetical protein